MTTDTVFDSAPVGELMHTPIITCAPDTPLDEVARLLATHRIHAVVVAEDADAEGADWGIVSDIDLVSGAASGSVRLCASDMQATPVVMIAPDDSLRHAAQLMGEYQVSRLLVVDSDRGYPVGIISTLDLAQALAR